jgi:hypothetical protein
MRKYSGMFCCLVIIISIIGASNAHASPSQHSQQYSSFSKINFHGDYSINDSLFGNKTMVTIEGNKRIMITNGLPNHSTGRFPNAIAAQELKYSIPVNPVFTGKAKWAREPGVALNGVKFEPETAEAFVCESGEHYLIEAFQSMVNLGLDSNHAHVQPTGAYHYHGAPTRLLEQLDKGEDTMLVGFARDGFPIYYSKSGKYKPSFKLSEKSRTGDVCSYRNPKTSITKTLSNTNPDGTFVSDWEYVKGMGDLDECNGIALNGRYVYFVTANYPYVGRCLMGEFKEQRPPGPPRGKGGPPPPPGANGVPGLHPHPH